MEFGLFQLLGTAAPSHGEGDPPNPTQTPFDQHVADHVPQNGFASCGCGQEIFFVVLLSFLRSPLALSQAAWKAAHIRPSSNTILLVCRPQSKLQNYGSDPVNSADSKRVLGWHHQLNTAEIRGASIGNRFCWCRWCCWCCVFLFFL